MGAAGAQDEKRKKEEGCATGLDPAASVVTDADGHRGRRRRRLSGEEREGDGKKCD
jgi:hypothetical protein